MDFNQLTQQFQAEISSKGITPPNEMRDDAKVHRFYIQGDKLGTKNGWYIFFRNNIPCGVFGNWKEGITYKWCTKSFRSMSQSEYRKYTQQILEAKKLRDEARGIEQLAAAEEASKIWDSANVAALDHPYLVNKIIEPFCARQIGGNLVLPIIDVHGKQRSLQYISPKGEKWFLTDGAIRANYIPIQHQLLIDRTVLISEGFATGATLAAAYPDLCVVAACNAGNLKPVALKLRQNLPKAKLIIAADDDRLTPGNPGLKKAREAAIAASALFAKPQWPEGTPEELSDFNDLACWLRKKMGDLA